MLLDWLRFDVRLMQWLRLWNVLKAIHIYGWWAILCWPFELILGSLHVFGVSHVLQLLLNGRHARMLSVEEKQIAASIFQDKINYSLVRLNGKSRIARRMRIAFVTGNLINFYRGMSYKLFVHEMTHVFQFQCVGLVYIPRCLMAQYSREGYNFGKVEDHEDILRGESRLSKLNYEQQAEFVETIYANQEAESILAMNVNDYRWIQL